VRSLGVVAAGLEILSVMSTDSPEPVLTGVVSVPWFVVFIGSPAHSLKVPVLEVEEVSLPPRSVARFS
jgi:hypothetical protein